MYGLGYGLARMAEGASGGALKGKLTQMGLEEKEKTRKSETDYRTATLAQGERGLDLREQGLAQQADIEQKKLDAQKALGLDDAGMKMYSEGVKIGLGMLGQGHSEAARDFMNRLFVQFKQPQQIDKLEETQQDEWKATTSDGGVWLFNGKTGVVKQIQETGQDTAADKEKKVSGYATFITKTLEKYKVGSSGITFDAQGKPSVDLMSLLKGQQSAYQVLKQKVDAGDKEATQDLKDLRAAYDSIKELLAIGQASKKQAAPTGRLDQMAGGNQVQTGMQKELGNAPGGNKQQKTAVFDPATGRFTYK